MSKVYRIAAVLLLGILASGCANQNIKPGEVICPLLGSVAGAGLVAGALDADEAGAIAAGAVVGAGLGYFLCMDRTEPPKPAPAPRPAPKPAPKPAPPADTDGDGVIDANDDCPGTPKGVKVNARGCPEVGEKLMTLEGVNFDYDSAKLRPESESVLDAAVTVLNENPSVHVRIEGHTDSRGSDAYNRKLSERRAQSVVAYLVSRGIDAGRLSAIGYGESAPVAPNDTAENMYKNRRVELVVTDN
ncbi:MAG: OmpA family protein [Gammaproteobacteria bacterium]